MPDRRDLTPGNAATLYYRAMASFVENSQSTQGNPRSNTGTTGWKRRSKICRWTRWAKSWVSRGICLHEVEVAAHCKDCDWQIEDRPEGVGLLLPEVQGFRNVAVVLAVRARYEIAQGKWDDAAQTLQTGYAVGRHMGQGPTLIHVLVGGAVARLMDEQVEAWIQQPGARISTGR